MITPSDAPTAHYVLINDDWEIPTLSVNGLRIKAVFEDLQSAQACRTNATGYRVDKAVLISKELADSLEIC